KRWHHNAKNDQSADGCRRCSRECPSWNTPRYRRLRGPNRRHDGLSLLGAQRDRRLVRQFILQQHGRHPDLIDDLAGFRRGLQFTLHFSAPGIAQLAEDVRRPFWIIRVNTHVVLLNASGLAKSSFRSDWMAV